MALPRYRSSGRTHPVFFPALVAAVAFAAGAGWLYERVVNWVPLIFLNILLFVFFLALIAFLAIGVVRLGKNRSRLLGALAGLLIAASALAASHYSAFQQLRGKAVDELVERGQPADEARAVVEQELTFSRYVDLRVETGWTIGRATSSAKGGAMTGTFVWIVWGIEALGMLIAGLTVASEAKPFCERCRTWMKEDVTTRFDLAPEEVDALAQARTAEDLLPPLQPGQALSAVQAKLTLFACPTCQGDGYLTVEKTWEAATRKGKESKKKTLLEQVTLGPAQVARLMALKGELADDFKARAERLLEERSSRLFNDV